MFKSKSDQIVSKRILTHFVEYLYKISMVSCLEMHEFQLESNFFIIDMPKQESIPVGCALRPLGNSTFQWPPPHVTPIRGYTSWSFRGEGGGHHMTR